MYFKIWQPSPLVYVLAFRFEMTPVSEPLGAFCHKTISDANVANHKILTTSLNKIKT